MRRMWLGLENAVSGLPPLFDLGYLPAKLVLADPHTQSVLSKYWWWENLIGFFVINIADFLQIVKILKTDGKISD